MTLMDAEKTNAYGRWKVTGIRPDGGTVEGWGSSPQAAEWNAHARARDWERCEGCNRVNVRPYEAKLSHRALGVILCAGCREQSEGQNPDFEREQALGF